MTQFSAKSEKIKKSSKIPSKKRNLRNFLTKNKIDFFFYCFLERCNFHSSKGTKNNEEKIFSSFREFWEILEKNLEKKGIFDFGEFFWKKELSDFFSGNISKDLQKHILWGSETIMKNYQVVLRYGPKKKVDRPSHPSHPIPSHPIHPIIRQYESGQKAWEPGGVGEKATYRHSSNPLIL